MIKSMVVRFCLLGVDATLSDGVDLITLAQFQGSEVYPGLFQDYGWVYKTLTLSTVVQHSVVVMSERLNPTGSQFSIPVF